MDLDTRAYSADKGVDEGALTVIDKPTVRGKLIAG